GARVMVVGKAGWRFDRLKRLGFACCLDATAAGSVVEEIRGLTGGRGADVVIEATGTPEGWGQGVDAVGRGGTVGFFWWCAPRDFDPPGHAAGALRGAGAPRRVSSHAGNDPSGGGGAGVGRARAGQSHHTPDAARRGRARARAHGQRRGPQSADRALKGN